MAVREKLVELLEEIPHPHRLYPDLYVDRIIAKGVTVQEWIPVDERLPEEKSNCIVYYKHAFCDDENHIGICVCFYDGNEFQLDFLHKVTHWMPLPLEPEVKND